MYFITTRVVIFRFIFYYTERDRRIVNASKRPRRLS